jgi:hypothetical protein
VLTVFASATFAVVLLGAGLAYELWVNAGAGRAARTRCRPWCSSRPPVPGPH